MSATLLWDVQDRVTAILSAALSVPVYSTDDLVGDEARAYVTVGERDPEADDVVAERAIADAGNRWHDELGAIQCVVEAWSGDNVAAVRATVRSLLDQCVGAINSDPSLGGLLDLPGHAFVSLIGLRQAQTSRGPIVRAAFTVSYSALITEGTT